MKKRLIHLQKNIFWFAVFITLFAHVPASVKSQHNSVTGAAKLMVGVAETIITPQNPIGFPMAGYDRGGHNSTGVHDDLYARSIVVEGADKTAIAMITVAVVNMNAELMNKIRTGIEKQTGIPFKNIAISCTHTHSGPQIGKEDESYSQFLVNQSIQSAVRAWKGRIPGKIGFGSTRIFGLAMNDRRMNHGGMPADPEAGVIKIEDAKGRLTGLFFNFGCHPSTLDLHNLLFTEDWPYYSIKGLKDRVGKNVIVGYFQSAQGDAKVGYQAELSAVGANMNGIRSFEYAQEKGQIMTDAVLKLLPSIKTSGDLVIKASYDIFDFPARTTYPYTHAEAVQWQARATTKLAEMEKLLGTKIGPRMLDTYKVDLWLANQAEGRSKIIEANPNPAPFRMPMQALRLGKTVFVTVPAEVFTEIGLTIKKQSPYKTFVLGLAGGFGGYVPTPEEYLEQGYAVNGSPYAPECAQVMINAAKTLIERISGN